MAKNKVSYEEMRKHKPLADYSEKENEDEDIE